MCLNQKMNKWVLTVVKRSNWKNFNVNECKRSFDNIIIRGALRACRSYNDTKFTSLIDETNFCSLLEKKENILGFLRSKNGVICWSRILIASAEWVRDWLEESTWAIIELRYHQVGGFEKGGGYIHTSALWLQHSLSHYVYELLSFNRQVESHS